MDPTQNNDINQVGPDTNTTPMQSGNMLTPQQRYQQMQYANSLMTNQGGTPVNSLGAGIGELGKALIGGYLMNKAMPMGQSQSSGPMQPLSATGQPMQLPSAGGSTDPSNASSIFSGLFPGMSSSS